MEKVHEASQRVTITGQGRIPLSRRVRDEAGFETGDQLLMTVLDHGGVLLETPSQKLRRVQDEVRRNWAGETDVVTELAEERRADAAREAAEGEADEGGTA